MKLVSHSQVSPGGQTVGFPFFRPIAILAVMGCWGALSSLSALGADRGVTEAPGFRPGAQARQDRAFADALADGSMIVLPTAVRTVDGVAHDSASAELLADFLRTGNMVDRVEVGVAMLALPELPGGGPQFELFQRELRTLEETVDALQLDADHVMLLEVLVTPRRRGGEAVGGIQCFVLTREGRNAFSFLLNAHHRIFADANLRTESVGEDARADLVARATRVAAQALQQQIAAVGH